MHHCFCFVMIFTCVYDSSALFLFSPHTPLVVVVWIVFLPLMAAPPPLSFSLNQNGESALHLAANGGSADVARILVDANADLHLVDKVRGWDVK